MSRSPAAVFSQDRYLAALRFAAQAHVDQKVPGTNLPYVVHVTSVAMEVIGALSAEPCTDPDLGVQCALLHDVLEDTKTTFNEVHAAFGLAVAQGVDALTKRESVAKDERMADSLARIRAQPPAVGMVKLADRITNLQPPPSHWTPDRCARYRAEAQQILSALQDRSAFLAQRLRTRIDSYRAYCGEDATTDPTSGGDRYFICGMRPVQYAMLPDGGATVLVYDWDTGSLVRDMTWLSKIFEPHP